MRKRFRWTALWMVAVLLVAACSNTGGSPSAAAPSVEASAPAASEPAASEPAASEAAAGCAQSGDLEMWERSGGNAGMVDALVAAWNEAYPDCKINLTYIPHTEMVSKIAQGIASGEVPDLMGMDLIYAPQFEDADQLVDVTDADRLDPRARDREPGPPHRRDLRGPPLRRAALRRRLRAVLQQDPVRAGRPRSREARRPAWPRSASTPDKITALGDDIKGYYLPGNCAGCNIFTVGPLMWASGAKIEAAGPGDEPLVGDGVKQVLEWARDMVKAGNVHESAQAENGETFHLQFGSGKLGMMGTGNFNITLARDQMVDHPFEFGISLLPGVEEGSAASFIGGDLVVIPKGSTRVDDAVNFMKFLLSDEVQVEVYAKALNLTTRSDMTDNQYFEAEPLVQDVAKALEVGTTPYTLTFFEQINSPQGPWLQMLQRAYYTDDDIDTIIAETKEADEGHRRRLIVP